MSAVDRTRGARTGARPARRRTQATTRETGGSRAAWASLGGLVIALALLGAAVAGFFTVRTVRVVGVNLPTAAIVQAADVSGKNIFRVRSDAVVDRVSSVPGVVVTKVEASFPDTLTIYAWERRPVAAWQQGKSYVLLDIEGQQIGQVAATRLPVVTGTGRPTPTQLVAIRYAARRLPAVTDGALANITIVPGKGLQLTGKTGWIAILGDGGAQKMVNRVGALSEILTQMPGRNERLKDADLRYGHAIVHVEAP